jgi:hypothetical protein
MDWMTTGQLLEHMTTACGACCEGFRTGDWSSAMGDAAPSAVTEIGLPAASAMPSAKSVAGVLAALEKDKRLTLDAIDEVGEKDLAAKSVAAPWDTAEKPLGRQFLHMIGHLDTHKSQLFYYLKLQGKPVHTGHLYGM